MKQNRNEKYEETKQQLNDEIIISKEIELAVLLNVQTIYTLLNVKSFWDTERFGFGVPFTKTFNGYFVVDIVLKPKMWWMNSCHKLKVIRPTNGEFNRQHEFHMAINNYYEALNRFELVRGIVWWVVGFIKTLTI